jgi:hypothetical protein
MIKPNAPFLLRLQERYAKNLGKIASHLQGRREKYVVKTCLPRAALVDRTSIKLPIHGRFALHKRPYSPG